MIKAIFFGQVPYLSGLKIQEFLFRSLPSQIMATKTEPKDDLHFLCLFEHNPPAYTVGIREQLYSLEEEEKIRKSGAEFHRVKRGGLITFHGPGQLVAYPIFNLQTLPGHDTEGRRMGVRRFVYLVEEVVIQMLRKEFQLKGVARTNDPGVWLDGDRKIAALGIQVRHGITSHGLALNCNTQLQWFEKIVPCGLHGKSVTSISRELGRTIRVEDVLDPICEHFKDIFQIPVNLEKRSDFNLEEFMKSRKDDENKNDAL